MSSARRPLIIALIVTWVLAVLSALGAFGYAKHLARQQVFSQLAVAARVETALQARQLTELRLRADHLAHDPAFVEYVAQSLIPDPARGGAIDSTSIADLLDSRRKDYDLALVLDPTGKPAARSGTLLAKDSGIGNDAAIQRAIATLEPQQEMRVEQGQIILVVVEPLLRGGALQGVLYAAKQLDSGFAMAVSKASGVDIALVATPAAAQATLPDSGLAPALVQAIRNSFSATPAPTQAGSRRLSLQAGGTTLPAIATPLRTVGGRATLIALDSAFTAPSAAATLAWPLWLGIAILALIASGATLLRWRRTDAPLESICTILERGVHGDHELVIRTHGSTALRRLRDEINTLLAQAARDGRR